MSAQPAADSAPIEARPMPEAERLAAVCARFHRLFAERFQVRVTGGFHEPFYRAPTPFAKGEIQYRHDYLNSCLHEIAHWLVAGPERRQRDDFGYWYAPDGRNAEQQAEFFRNEVKPQAMECALAEACGAEFRISVDNLSGDAQGGHDLQLFANRVACQKAIWEKSGFPARAQELLEALAPLKSR
jgi:elongation factor P hydroxylase